MTNERLTLNQSNRGDIMRNERLLELARLQVQYEKTIDRDDSATTHAEKMQVLTHLCAEFTCSFKEFQYLERCLIN